MCRVDLRCDDLFNLKLEAKFQDTSPHNWIAKFCKACVQTLSDLQEISGSQPIHSTVITLIS